MNYYNEHDREKAEWLRELIRRNVISEGEVDERGIQEVGAEDLREFRQCHFFAGIGVWSYALRLAGWPDDRPVWTGSCPCPSFSAAGKGGGFNDPRHLWPDWARLIRIGRPATIFGEQADDAIGYGWLDLVQTDLERADYAVGKAVLTAAGVGAPHARERLYFVAHAKREQLRAEGSGRPASAQAGMQSENWERERIWDDPRECGSGVRLAHSESERCGEAGKSSRRQAERAGDRGEHGELENAHKRRRIARNCAAGPSAAAVLAGQSSKSDLGDTGRQGLSKRISNRGIQQQTFFAPTGQAIECGGYVNGFWRDADWVLRKRWNSDDFEWCPTEPGTFPLASGVTGRVLKLRGYGDSIVAEVAKEFILAAYL